MRCPNCNESFANGYSSCPHCGTHITVSDGHVVAVSTGTVRAAPKITEESMLYARRALRYGVLSLVFCFIAGIFFGHAAKKNAAISAGLSGMLYGRAKAGRILGTIGFIYSIVSTCTLLLDIAVVLLLYSFLG